MILYCVIFFLILAIYFNKLIIKTNLVFYEGLCLFIFGIEGTQVVNISYLNGFVS